MMWLASRSGGRRRTDERKNLGFVTRSSQASRVCAIPQDSKSHNTRNSRWYQYGNSQTRPRGAGELPGTQNGRVRRAESCYEYLRALHTS